MQSQKRKTSFEKYVRSFFNKLEIYEDKFNEKKYKQEIITSVSNFLKYTKYKSSKFDYVYNVYEAFFKAYWIGTNEKENPFLTLIEKVKSFEKLAGRLTQKQRDHYVHSIFVFLIGIAIYEQNSTYREIFNKFALDKSKYPDSYDTNNEEFLYRWGLASLFHDIAYPLEITLEQANSYADFICSYPKTNDKNLKIALELRNFEEFRKLPIISPDPKYEEDFIKKYPDYRLKFLDDSVAILSESIATCFSLDFKEVNNSINQFIESMKNDNFIDHGLFSSLIILRWYHFLVKSTKWNPAYFYYPIADSASAIFLHNYFERNLMESFSVESLSPEVSPIAYLLILCDNLQEWKREFYGQDELKNKFHPSDFKLIIDNYTLEMIYEVSDNSSNESKVDEKWAKIYKLLKINDIFEHGITLKEVKIG